MVMLNAVTNSKPVGKPEASRVVHPAAQAPATPASTASDTISLSGATASGSERRPVFSPPTPKPPPEVHRIERAVDTAVEQKRDFLAVLSHTSPRTGGEVDLRA